MGTELTAIPRGWGQTPRQYRGDGDSQHGNTAEMGTMHLPEKIEWFKLPKIADPNTVRVFTKYLFCIRPRSQHRQVIRHCVYTVDII